MALFGCAPGPLSVMLPTLKFAMTWSSEVAQVCHYGLYIISVCTFDFDAVETADGFMLHTPAVASLRVSVALVF